MKKLLNIYTDGSCNTQTKVGAWATIIFINDKKIKLSGLYDNTTHQRMELLAVIESIRYIISNKSINYAVKIYTDSQYVCRTVEQSKKLQAATFRRKNNKPIANSDLVITLLSLIEELEISFVKLRAHQKIGEVVDGENFNREVDKLARQILRKQAKLDAS